MRRFPSSWDKTLSALGFRRNVKRIKRDHYRRKNRRVETLEVRAMLAGDTFVVTTLADQSDNDLTDGVSLREAIVQADAAGGTNTITFDETLFAGGAKTLLLGDTDGNGLIEGTEDPTQLYVDSALTIEGPGSDQLTISGADDTRILQVQTNQEFDVSISGLTIAEGLADKGAGIYSHGNNLTLDDINFSNNYAMTWDSANNRFVGKQGGALNFQGQDWLDHSTLTITNSTFDSNYGSHGGAIYSYGGYAHIDIDATTFSNNHAFYLMDDQLEVITTTSVHNGFGGALSFTSYDLHNSGNKGSVEIKNSTLHHNQAERDGGAIASGRSYFTLDIINSTISSNEAYRAGAIKVSYNQDVTILNSTITENSVTGWSSSGGIDNQTNNPANLTLHNTIVAGNTSPSGSAYDLRGNLETASSHNLIGRWTVPSATPTGAGNQISDTMDPGLLPLGDYGGPTLTHGLEADSLAIDAGDTALAVSMASDQRGGSSGFSDRTVGELATIDIGAFEYGATTIEVSEASYIASEAPFDVSTISGLGTISSSWIASNDAGDTVTVWRGTGAEGTGTYYSILNGTTQQLSQARLVDLGQDSTNLAPKVVIDGNGNFAISWLSYSQVDGSKSYWIRRYDSSGSPIDALPVQIAEFNQFKGYSISANESGRILVVWQDEDAVEGESLYFRRYTTTGLSLDAAAREFFPSTTNDISLTTSGRTAVVKSDGGFYLTWHEAGEIRVAEFTPDGFQSGEATVVDAPTFESPNTGYVTPLDIALGPNDTAYVAWLRNTTVPLNATSSDSVRELLVAQVETGGELGNIANVQNVTSHDEWVTIDDEEWYVFEDYLHVERPSLSVDGLGRFGIAWERTEGWSFSGVGYSPQAQGQIVQAIQQNSEIEDLYEVDYIDRDVAVAWFDVNGAALQSAPIKVVNDAGESNRLPTLTSDASGNFVLTSQQSNDELWAQQFSLPKVVSLDYEGTLKVNDQSGQFEELSLGTELIEGTQRVTFNGILTQYVASKVKKIVIYAGHGDNRIDLSRLETSHFNLQGSIDTNALSGPIEVYAGAGNDVLFAPAIGAVLHGEAGDDRLVGSDTIDVLLGGEGEDLLIGGDGNDTLKGGLDNDTIKGGEGNDALYGGEGDDYLLGEAGADELYGEEGKDRLDGGVGDLDANWLYGGEGDDTYLLENKSEGVLGTTVLITDASGIDTIDLSEWTGSLGVNLDLSAFSAFQSLNTSDAHSLVIIPDALIENVIGTPNDDELTGNSQANQLEGRGGNDTLKGLDGDDTLLGHSGDDELHGEAGNDSLLGHEGGDMLYAGITADNGGGGNDTLEGGVGDDIYYLFEEEANLGVTITATSTVTIIDAGGENDKLDATSAAYTATYTDLNDSSNQINVRVLLLETSVDQTIGNITLEADGLSGIDIFTETEGLILPVATNLPDFYAGFADDVQYENVVLPKIDLAAWDSTATGSSATPWTHTLTLKDVLPTDNYFFFTLGEDAPEGMALDTSTNLLSWSPTVSHEGSHTFTIHATRYGTAILRTSSEVTINVSNDDLPPEIVVESFIAKGIDGTLYGAIEGEVLLHDSLDYTQVVLTYSNGTETATDIAYLSIDGNDPYRGRFEHELTEFEVSKLLGTSSSEILTVTAQPRIWHVGQDPEYTLGTAESISLTLNQNETSLAQFDSFGLDQFAVTGTGDKVTTNPTFKGSVSKNNGISAEDLIVRFYLKDPNGVEANDKLFGSTRTEADGSFSYTPHDYDELEITFTNTHKYESLDIYAKVFDQLPGGTEEATSSSDLEFTLVQETAPRIDLNIANNDTSVFAKLEGNINWQDPSLSLAEREIFELAHEHQDVTIEISYDIDAGVVDDHDNTVYTTIEGIAVTNELGEFTYLPVGLEVGETTSFEAKAVYWDDYLDDLVESSVKTLNFTPQLSAASLVAGDLELKYPKDPTSTDGEATDPTITGTATKGGVAQGNLYVEYSIGADFDDDPNSNTYKQADGVVVTDEEGQFELTPIGLVLGVLTPIYVRAAERNITVEDNTTTTNDPDDVIVTESWTYQEEATVGDKYPSINVTLEAATLPTIENLELPYDTGPNTGDKITSNPTIRGNVAGYYGDMSVVTVQYMVNGVIAGELVPEEDGSFEFLAEGYIDGMIGGENSEAPNEVFVRAIIPDYSTEAPEFENGLLGTDADGDTTSGWFTEDYFSGGTGWSSTLNQDWFDEVLADEGVGLQGSWYNSSFTRDWDGVLDKIEGVWSESFSFTYDSTAALVASATVVHDGGTNPTFHGKLSNVDAADANDVLVGKVLEFYLNDSTEPDGRTVTHELIGTGTDAYNYSYTPSKFTENNDIRIVIIEPVYGSDNSQEIDVTNPYDSTGVTLDIDLDTTLVVSSLELANPLTDADAMNPATATDPTLQGQIAIPGDVALQIIEFDYDNDGVADAYTYTDAEGGFWHQPEGIGSHLIGDNLSVRARVAYQVFDHDNHTTHNAIGDWSDTLSWTHVPQSAPEFVSFQLEQDTGHYEDFEVLDGKTSNPNLVGEIVSNGVPVAYQTIDFDHNGDGLIDGRSSTDSEGKFRYEPEGLTEGNWDIRARVSIEDITTGSYLSTDWTSVTRTGRPADTASGIGFKLVPPEWLEVTSFIQNNSTTTDPSVSGTVNWDVTGDPVAKNVVVEFFDTSDDTRLGSTTTDENGNFSFVPVGIEDGMTIVAKPVQSVIFDTNTYPVLTVSFTEGASVSPTVRQVDFNTVEIEVSSLNSVAYYEFRVVEPTEIWGQPDFKHEAEIISATVSSSSSGAISYLMKHEFDYSSYPDNAVIEVRPVLFDGTSYTIGAWATKALPAKANLSFAVSPDFQREQDLDENSSSNLYVANTEAQVVTKIADANSYGFTYNGNAVHWEYEVEYDLDGDGVADYRFTVDDPTSSLTHELTGLVPGDYDFQSRVIGYGTFNEVVQTGDSTLTKETTHVLEGDWLEQSLTYANPGPTVDVENNNGLATSVSHPVPTDATIVGSITSPLGATLSGMTVEVDENLDGSVDGYAYVQSDGTFEYTVIDPTIGDNSIQLRGVDPYSSPTNLKGDWVPLTFTLAPEEAPEISSLELESYELVGHSGNLPKTDSPVIVGTVNLPDNTAALTQWVEFDHDGDGVADGTATLDSFGNFEYTPTNLAYGSYYNQRARTVVQLSTQQLVGTWSDEYTETAQQSFSFLYEPDALPEISGDVEVLDVALGLVAGRATLNGFGYAGKVAISVQQAGSEVSSLTAYSNESGRFEFELLELTTGTYDLVITPQLVDSNADSGYYSGNERTATDVNYSPIALSGTPELATFDLVYNTGSSSANTSDPTLEGTVDLAAFNNEAPPQLYVEISFDREGTTSIQTLPVRSDGTFEWTPSGLVEGDLYLYTAKTKIWNPDSAIADYEYGILPKQNSFTLVQVENYNPTISSLDMQFNEANSGEDVHVSADAAFSGQISNDGRLGGHTVLFDHNQDGIIDGQTITLDDGSFFYRAEGIEASDTLTQTMTAWVVETDYWGEELASIPETRDFKLTRAPIIREVVFKPGTNKVEGSLFSETDPSDLWIEYEFFGASLPGGNPPSDVSDYVDNYAGIERLFVSVDSSGNFEIDLPSAATGNLSIVLRGVDSRNLDLSSTLIEDYDTLAYEEDAIKGVWRLTSFDTDPTEVGNFRLLEDTGAVDDITSNPTVAGTVRPFEVVEIKTVMMAMVGGAYEVDSFVTNRITADGNGNFEFVSPAFESTYSPNDRFEVTARTVSFDLTNDTESFGAYTSAVAFDYVENGTSISLSADTSGLITGTVSAHATNGRVAGLRVELDLQYSNGQAYDDVADGYAITDSNGNFSYQVYGFVSGETVDIKAQVIEWDPAMKAFTDPGFVATESTVDSDSFTAVAAAAVDPSLSEEVTSSAYGDADLVLNDTVKTVLADVSELDDGGNLDLGVWSIDVLGRGGAGEAGPEGDGSDLVTIVTTSSVPLADIDEFSWVLENPELTGELGIFDVSYSASRAWGTNGQDDTLTTTLDIWLEEYNHNDDPSLDLAFANNSGTPTYSFQFVATGTKTATDFEIDTYSTTETSSYDFYTEDHSYTPDGTLYRTEITAGSYELLYTELNIPVIAGTVDRDFSSTEISNIETWVTETDSDSSDGVTSNLSDHSTYYERSESTGTISASGTSGTNTINAQGFYESNLTSTFTSTDELTSQGSSGGTLSLTDTSTDSVSDSYTYRGNLNTEDVYTVGGNSNLTFNLHESITSSYNQNGSGTYERAEEDGNWHYSAGGSASSTSTLNGKSYEGTDYSSVDAAISSSSNQSLHGSGGGSSSYDETSSPGNTDEGTASSSYSYNLNANSNLNATLSSYNEDYAVRGKQSVSSSASTSSSGEVNGTLETDKDNVTSTTDYGTRTRSSANSSANSVTDFQYTSAGDSSASGTFSINASASGVVASQSSGEFVDNSTGTTVTTPFRNNVTVESSLTFTSDGDFSSQISPGVEEVYSVTGHNTRDEKSEIRSTDYFAINTVDSEGNPGAANAENFSLTKTHSKTESLEDYDFVSSNDVESREGEFENHSTTTVEVTESIVYETEDSSADGKEFENTKYSSKKDTFFENTSSSEGPFSEIDGQSKAYATVDESFASYGTEKEIFEASGQAPEIQDGEWVLENWKVYSKEAITFDTTSKASGFVDLVNEEVVDSLMDVESENNSEIETADRSSLITTGTKKVDDRTVNFTEGGGLKESLTLSNQGTSEGTVEHDGSSLMLVDSTEKIKASTKNSSYYIEGTPLGSLFFRASTYILGSTKVNLDKTTNTKGEVSQGGATPDPSAEQIDLRNPSSSFDITTSTKTSSEEKSKWSIQEHEGDPSISSPGTNDTDANYKSENVSGNTESLVEVSEKIDATVNQYETGDRYEKGEFVTTYDVSESGLTSSGGGSYRQDDRSGYTYYSSNISSIIPSNTIEGTYTDLNGDLTVKLKEDVLRASKSRKDYGTYKTTSGNGTRETSDNGLSGSSSTSKSEGGGGKDSNESKSNSFSRNKSTSGTVTKSDINSDSTSKSVVDGETSNNAGTQFYDNTKSIKSKGATEDTTIETNVYSDNSTTAFAFGDFRMLLIVNKSGESKTKDEDHHGPSDDYDTTQTDFSWLDHNPFYIKHQEFDTTDFTTTDTTYLSIHTVDSDGNATGGFFTAKSDIVDGGGSELTGDISATYGNGDTYSIDANVSLPHENFTTTTETGNYFDDDGSRRQSGNYTVTNGSRDPAVNNKYKVDKDIKTYRSDLTYSITTKGSYDIYGRSKSSTGNLSASGNANAYTYDYTDFDPGSMYYLYDTSASPVVFDGEIWLEGNERRENNDQEDCLEPCPTSTDNIGYGDKIATVAETVANTEVKGEKEPVVAESRKVTINRNVTPFGFSLDNKSPNNYRLRLEDEAAKGILQAGLNILGAIQDQFGGIYNSAAEKLRLDQKFDPITGKDTAGLPDYRSEDWAWYDGLLTEDKTNDGTWYDTDWWSGTLGSLGLDLLLGAKGASRISQEIGEEALEQARKRGVKESTEETAEFAKEQVVNELDEVNGYWWNGRYTTAASQPGAYQKTGGAVFPTRRNSGLTVEQGLRAEQQAFTLRQLEAGRLPSSIRGQAREAGLTTLDSNSKLADKGAEKAVHSALEIFEKSK